MQHKTRDPRIAKVESMLTVPERLAIDRLRERQSKRAKRKITRSDYIREILREHLGLAC